VGGVTINPLTDVTVIAPSAKVAPVKLTVAPVQAIKLAPLPIVIEPPAGTTIVLLVGVNASAGES